MYWLIWREDAVIRMGWNAPEEGELAEVPVGVVPIAPSTNPRRLENASGLQLVERGPCRGGRRRHVCLCCAFTTDDRLYRQALNDPACNRVLSG